MDALHRGRGSLLLKPLSTLVSLSAVPFLGSNNYLHDIPWFICLVRSSALASDSSLLGPSQSLCLHSQDSPTSGAGHIFTARPKLFQLASVPVLPAELSKICQVLRLRMQLAQLGLCPGFLLRC